MPKPTVAANISQSRNRLRRLSTQWTFHDIVAFQQSRQATEFVLGKVSCLFDWVDTSFVAKFARDIVADTEKVSQRDVRFLIVWNIDTQKTWHVLLFFGLLI